MQTPIQNLEYALLTRVIDTKDFHTLEKMQINEGYFLQSEPLAVYKWLAIFFHHPHTAGMVPTREMVQFYFPGFMFFQSGDHVAVLATILRQERLRVECIKLGQDLQLVAERDVKEAVKLLKEKVVEVNSYAEVGEDLSMSGAYNALLARYELLQETGGVIGIPYPWDLLNEETQGMQGGQLIVVYGRMKNMKTWVSSYIATHAYAKSRRKVLYYTKEMSPFQVAQRVASILAGVDYKAFKNGKLQPELKALAFLALKDLVQDEKDFAAQAGKQAWFTIISDINSGGNGGGVSWLRSKVREYRPDLVIVDGMYRLKDDRTGKRTMDWKNVGHITQDLKETAQEFDIPLIGVTQANREADEKRGEDFTELSFADSIGMELDVALRVIKKQHVDQSGTKKTEIHLVSPGMREGDFDGIVIHANPGADFSFIRKITPEDSEKELKEVKPEKKHTFKNPLAVANMQLPKPIPIV